MTDADQDDKARKERSPSFPFIPLEKAIERARAMGDAHKRSPARPTTVADTWGYAPSSSGLQQTIAALKAFGLLEDIGKGSDRRVQLSDLAWRILHDTRPGAREQSIKEAALKPRLIAEYAQNWLPDRPSDNHCQSELHLDRGFTETAAKLFLRVFDETVKFANLTNGDSLSTNLENEQGFDPVAEPALEIPTARRFGVPPAAVGRPSPPTFLGQRDAPRAVLPLTEGLAALEIPTGLSRQSFDAVKAWVNVMLSLSERTVQENWYVETYRPNSATVETTQTIGSWERTKSFMDWVKAQQPDTVFRVIAPAEAKEADLKELSSMGVRTF